MKYKIIDEPLGYTAMDLKEAAPLDVPYNIMIDPSGKCNFACCFCPCNNSDEKKDIRHVVMSYEDFVLTVEGIKEFGKKVPVIDLYGFGEPLVNPDIVKMIRYIKQAEVCDYLRMTSNGALLTEELCNQLVESGLDYLKLSIEGIREEQYRSFCGVSIDFGKFVSTIAYLYRISRGKLKIGTKIISAAFENEEDRDLYMEIFAPITDYIYIRNVQRNWAEFDSMVFPGAIQDGVFAKNKVPGYKLCSYPLTHMVVHANGDIGLCCYDWKHDTVYANIRDRSAAQAWRSEELKRIRSLHLLGRKSELNYCSNCIRKGYDNIDSDAPAILERIQNGS